MERMLTFSRTGDGIELNGETYDRLEFVDLCAGFGHRLRAWRESALQNGMPAGSVRVSMAVDTKPRDGDVHRMDVISFLDELPDRSVRVVNGDYINAESPRRPKEAGLMETVAPRIARVLAPDGEVFLTMPLHMHGEVTDEMRRVRLKIEAIGFGYVGFLGGENGRGFPAAGLPPVEGVSVYVRQVLEHIKTQEETDPLASLFAEQIGTHAYLGGNPVRYRAVRA